MKRLAVIVAALLAVAACKPKDSGTTTTDSTSTTTTTPAMTPAPADTGMKKDTSMKMNMDTGMKGAAPAMKDSTTTTKKTKKS
jgi:hypothetical protein